jgi:ribosomal protein S18 acetylase RimI-like enzyme
MSTIIRQINSRDKENVFRIFERIAQFKPSEVKVAEELVDEYLQKGTASGYQILVAENSGVIVGYICYGPTPLTETTWDIYWEAVAPECQGYGIGSALINEAESNIKTQGGKRVLIETSSAPDYKNTRRFYLSHGYVQISCIPDFYGDGDHLVTYYKKFL